MSPVCHSEVKQNSKVSLFSFILTVVNLLVDKREYLSLKITFGLTSQIPWIHCSSINAPDSSNC